MNDLVSAMADAVEETETSEKALYDPAWAWLKKKYGEQNFKDYMNDEAKLGTVLACRIQKDLMVRLHAMLCLAYLILFWHMLGMVIKGLLRPASKDEVWPNK